MRGAHDGSEGFNFGINRLRTCVCNACARARLSVLPRSTMDCDASAAASRKIVGIELRKLFEGKLAHSGKNPCTASSDELLVFHQSVTPFSLTAFGHNGSGQFSS